MAESIEEMDKNTDVDLEMDKSGFKRAQFDVFKHNFLESFDEAGYEKLEHLTLDSKLKKEVVNMARRLQKARNSLESLKGEDRASIDPVIKKIEEVFANLIEFSKQSSEYSMRNVKLPDYDSGDMKALFGADREEKKGKSDGEDELDPVKWLCQSNGEYEKKIMELLGAGELMMNEWHEIRKYIKDF